MRFRTVTGVAVLLAHAIVAAPLWWAGASAQETPDSPLSRFLEAELGRFPGIAGLHVKHLTTGEEASVRGDERFESASTIKVAVMAHIYRMADAERRDSLNREVAQSAPFPGEQDGRDHRRHQRRGHRLRPLGAHHHSLLQQGDRGPDGGGRDPDEKGEQP